ncbi:hypothetical protein [Kaistia sp. MMO-174]|uniref:hypothetical protein n=1 Tax=Kaistia sp. MMO-174 TaxID=3081256 RepID=UPI00301B4279
MRRAILAFALLLASATARAQEPPSASTTAVAPAAAPVVRTTLDPKEGAVVGQHIALYVDVLFPGDMPHPPRVSIPDMPGAQVMRFESQATTISDTVDGARLNGQRFEFAVFPRRGGALSIPPARVTLLDRAGNVIGSASGEAVQETIQVPKGIDAKGVVVATEKLTLEQSWNPEPAKPLHAGDALVRTITRTATDIPALAMRDLSFDAPEGVRVYVDTPQNLDRSDRGTITGKRIDRATYVFEKAGSFALPAVKQPWWNLAGKQAETASGKAATVTVSPGPAPAATGGPEASKPAIRPETGAAIATLVVLAGLALAAFGPGWRRRAAERRAQRANSEATAFKGVIRACGQDDAEAIYAALATWRARLPATWPAPPEARPLEAALFSMDADQGKPRWSRAMAHELLARLRHYRRDCLARPARPAAAPLPPLNPARKMG